MEIREKVTLTVETLKTVIASDTIQDQDEIARVKALINTAAALKATHVFCELWPVGCTAADIDKTKFWELAAMMAWDPEFWLNLKAGDSFLTEYDIALTSAGLYRKQTCWKAQKTEA